MIGGSHRAARRWRIAKQQYLDGIVIHLQVDDIGRMALVEEIQTDDRSPCSAHHPDLRPAAHRDEEVDLARLTRAAVS